MNVLDVYYCIDVESNIDEEILAKCICVYIKSKLTNWKLNTFQKVSKYSCKLSKNQDDVVKHGLFQFRNMFKNMKLKSTNETWFIYVSNGKVENIPHEVGVILVNKVPSQNQCMYAISKSTFTPLKILEKPEKLEKVKIFSKAIEENFSKCKIINYEYNQRHYQQLQSR